MRIIIFGAPGAGKGTQAKIIAPKFNIPHISTGDILRKAAENKTTLGLKAEGIMKKGELVPNDIMLNLINDRLVQKDCEKGFILDGFPRTVTQAIELERIFAKLRLENILLVNIKINHEEIIKRLTERMACSSCGNIFNFNEIRKTDKCPSCEMLGTLYQRPDDKEVIIKKRLDVYENDTKPILKYYQSKKNIISVDGRNSVEDITHEILSKLNMVQNKLFYNNIEG